MSSDHTPGPWEFFSTDVGIGVTAPTADVAHCGGFDTRRAREEEEANAHLIAAAPDMLEALKSCEQRLTMQSYRLNENLIGELRAIIAKAEGRSTE